MHGIARGNSLSPIDPFTGFSAPRSEAGLAGVGDARKMIRGVVDEHSDVIKTLLKIVFLLALLLCTVVRFRHLDMEWLGLQRHMG